MRRFAITAALAFAAGSPTFAEAHQGGVDDAQSEAEEALKAAEEERVQRAYLNAQQAYLSSLQASDGWYTMEGGLRWRYVTYVGRGPSPAPTDTVTVHYEGSFIDGAAFDSSYERGTPATFPLSGLITAWEMAIPQMRVGETIELAAPASLAYGPRGRRQIPGGATLVFKVELLGIE